MIKIKTWTIINYLITALVFIWVVIVSINVFVYDNSKLPELEQEYCQSIHMDKVTKVIRYHEQSICTDGPNEREIDYSDDIFCEAKYKKLLGWCD